MSDRYVGLYGSEGQATEEAQTLEEEGIDVTVKRTENLDHPEGSNLPEDISIVAPWSLVFPDEDSAREAANFIRVGDITLPPGEMIFEGERRLRV